MIMILRPHQWIKNLFVFMPLFFSGQMYDSICWLQAFITFLAFSLMASAVYCMNDLRDIEADRQHPQKKNRPLASGKMKPVNAVILMTFLILSSLALAYFALRFATFRVFSVLIFYFCLNIAYTFKLKKVAIVDVVIVAFGFVLRLVAGGWACDIWLSPWIVLMTFLLALFLAFAKRRDDLTLSEKSKEETGSKKCYTLPFMNQTLGLIGAITIVCYVMYTVSPEVVWRFNCEYIYVTSIFVITGILRYLQLAMVENRTGSPTLVILQDRFIQCCVLLWLASFAAILYFL